MDKLIQGGTLVLPAGPTPGDLLLRGEIIAQIGRDLPYDPQTTEIFPADGCYVFPGFIDTHTHFQLDNGVVVSPDDFASGSAAALLGGTTTILDFATQNRGETLAQGLDNWHAMADGKTHCDYGFHLAVTWWNPSIAREITSVAAAGVTSFKVYMAYDNLRLRDQEIFALLEKVGEVGGILGCHCENGDLINCLIQRLRLANRLGVDAHPLSRPPEVEAEAIYRYLTIAKMAGAPVNIVHLSTAAGLAVVEAARAQGQEVYVETCPQYLLLEQSRYSQPDFRGAVYVMSPPLRRAADQEALWRGLALGQVDTVGTDHCSFNLAGQKDLGREDFTKIPNGIPGAQHRPLLLYTYGVAAGRVGIGDMARLLAENPAKLFGLYPRKGALAPGGDGDAVIWDPRQTGVISAANQRHNVDNTPYEGMAVTGGPRQVFLRGQLVVADGRLVAERQGRYLARAASLRFRRGI
ncbi:MAG: dihydropyrimidinase [Peptococcaceae bacterium]|jgi:dihydropyrimidinase|nr:dihydropyrimidinase [Peptococcaceae bacterium]